MCYNSRCHTNGNGALFVSSADGFNNISYWVKHPVLSDFRPAIRVTTLADSTGCFVMTVDITGQRFGKLLAIRPTKGRSKPKNGSVMWLCRCDCGNEKEISVDSLRQNRANSCGCTNVNRLKSMSLDVTGQRFGRLVAIKRSGSKKRYSLSHSWVCECDCGNTITVPLSVLRFGNTKSCGCLLRDWLEDGQKLDISGRKYGRLIAVRPTNKKYKSKTIWECKCSCGNIVEVPINLLQSGNTKSCGCLKVDILTKHGRSYTVEYRREITRRYNARKKRVTVGKLTDVDISNKFKALGNACFYCGSKENIEVDHLIPISRGGAHVLSNLVPACRSCNASKRDKYLGTEWQPPNWKRGLT